MAQEIERKFLVTGPFQQDATSHRYMVQGYLSSVPERTVRVRVDGTRAFLTIKGIGGASGASRFEWEHEIALDDATALLRLCEPGMIEKVRYRVPVGRHTFDVDEFLGDNAGLVVAEVELTHEDEHVERPEWLGAEVTGDPRYYNATLLREPYRQWRDGS